MKASEVKANLRVRLLPFEKEPEQFGECLSPRPCNGTIIVQLDVEYWDDVGDDGIREVPLEQVEPHTARNRRLAKQTKNPNAGKPGYDQYGNVVDVCPGCQKEWTWETDGDYYFDPSRRGKSCDDQLSQDVDNNVEITRYICVCGATIALSVVDDVVGETIYIPTRKVL